MLNCYRLQAIPYQCHFHLEVSFMLRDVGVGQPPTQRGEGERSERLQQRRMMTVIERRQRPTSHNTGARGKDMNELIFLGDRIPAIQQGGNLNKVGNFGTCASNMPFGWGRWGCNHGSYIPTYLILTYPIYPRSIVGSKPS